MSAAADLGREIGSLQAACAALEVPRSTFYRHRHPRPASGPRPAPPLALAPEERREVLELLRSPRFVDAAPRQVWAELLDEDVYLCSPRTMYRLLEAHGEVRERRRQKRHPAYTRPELLATAPNQVWSWDITKLKGPVKWSSFYLYVILDIYSRYVVGWLLAHRESESLAKRLIEETVAKQDVPPGQLNLHADRGPSMTSKTVALLLGDLGVTKTHNRPYTSNDNPYSEAQFKTLKYQPQFPERFGSYEDAHAFCVDFFAWYNTVHRHSGLALLTPEDVHYGRGEQVLERRSRVLEAAFEANPHRFKGRRPSPGSLPEAVWINPPREQGDDDASRDAAEPDSESGH